jgi:hypothetical protein
MTPLRFSTSTSSQAVENRGRNMTTDFAAGGFRFVPSVFQYSAGAAALPRYDIQRVRFRTPVPLMQGFERIEKFITQAGRPLTAFCACELRSPGQFTEQGFRSFNEQYVVTLQRWGLFDGKVNPVARSNVCPEIDPPAEPSFHAFSFTVAAVDAAPSFVIAGSAEAKEGGATYRERTVRYGETSPGAWRPSVSVGPIRRRRRSTPCTTSIRSWPTRSYGAVLPVRASPGTMRGRRCAISNTRWIAAVSAKKSSSDVLRGGFSIDRHGRDKAGHDGGPRLNLSKTVNMTPHQPQQLRDRHE